MGRTTTLIAGVAAALTLGAAPAGAAEIVGSDLVASPTSVNNTPRTATAITQRQGVSLPLTASAPGVIVEVKLKHSAVIAPGVSGFSILSGSFPNFTARTSALLPDFAWTVPTAAGTRSFPLNPGISIASGERLALRMVSGALPPTVASNNSPDATLSLLTGNHVDGQETYPAPFAFELMAQMRIEPDADFDGFGDETQDGSIASACLGLTPTKIGTPGNDVIAGTAGNDVIAAGGGDDFVLGLGGNDILCGGDGKDTLKGGGGKDKIFGEAGKDKLRGGAGRDVCKGGPKRDTARKCEKVRSL